MKIVRNNQREVIASKDVDTGQVVDLPMCGPVMRVTGAGDDKDQSAFCFVTLDDGVIIHCWADEKMYKLTASLVIEG